LAKLSIYDTTLRDGAQREGVSFSVEDKMRIARRLDRLGVDYIEGGWPGANPKDSQFFNQAKGLGLTHAKLTAFGSTCRPGVAADADQGLAALRDAETPAVAIFGKSWDFHVVEALKTSLDENLRMIRDTVAFFCQAGREVIFDAEHFFDGFKANPEYALACLRAAHGAGASFLVLCDTNGGSLPRQVVAAVEQVKEEIPGAALGIHAHNDSGLAVAVSLAAVEAGCVQVQGTMNGLGERCGNVDLCVILPILQLKAGYECIPETEMAQLTRASRYVAEIANLPPLLGQPFVGPQAFAHKGGIHVSALLRRP
jgi:2-isopropylmalate synthase